MMWSETGHIGASAKRIIRRAVLPLVFNGVPRIIIASTGRAGSTMLFEATAQGLIWSRFGCKPDTVLGKALTRSSSGYVARLSSIDRQTYAVYKTHDTFNLLPRGDYKVIFVYGDPLESAMSVDRIVREKGESWFVQHQYHLHGAGELRDLFNKDVLNYAGHLKDWLGQYREGVLCVDYDDLWISQAEISSFLGFQLQLPLRRPRRTIESNAIIDHELFADLRRMKDMLKHNYQRRDFELSD